MRPTEVQTEQVRELLAPARNRATGRRRADFAVTARWLRTLRTRSAGERASSRPPTG